MRSRRISGALPINGFVSILLDAPTARHVEKQWTASQVREKKKTVRKSEI